jgi:uncharacterized protein
MPNEFDVSVINTINVDNYDEFAKKIANAGGKKYTEKRNVPELGVTGSFLDSEGSKFAIIEYKKNGK